MRIFKPDLNKKSLIKHIDFQKQNINDVDNLISVNLTIEEIDYIITELKKK